MTRFSLQHLLAGLVAATALAAAPARATPPLPPPILWPAEGLSVANQPGPQFAGDIVHDQNGGAIVAWTDMQGDDQTLDLYLQRVSFLGQISWSHRIAGFPLCTASGRQFMVRLAPDGLGGAIATWYDERGASPDIYALRVRWDGYVYPSWPAEGLPVCTAPGAQLEPVITSDGNEGAYIAWEDVRDGELNTHVYVQHVTGEGTVEYGWPVDGLRVSDAAAIEIEPSIAMAPGGAYVTWVRKSTLDGSTGDVAAARITSSGDIAPGWPDSGLVLCAAPSLQDKPSAVADGQGGLFAVWRDYRDEADLSGENRSDVYAQHVTEFGSFRPGWGGNGAAVRVDSVDQWIPKAAADGVGGLLVSWWSDPEVFVQRLTPEGTVAPGWTLGGVSVGTATATGQGPALAAAGDGGAIVAWNEYHPTTTVDVYAQRITENGQTASGWPPGGIAVTSSIRNEQVGGGTARVSTIVPDRIGGALIAWTDLDAPSGSDVRVQRVLGNGVVGPWECYGCGLYMSLSPNPGKGPFRVSAQMSRNQTRAVIEVYDVLGRRLRTRTYEGLIPSRVADLDLDLSGLPAGVYYVRLAGGPGMPTMASRSVVLLR